jgi:hypothetical protein
MYLKALFALTSTMLVFAFVIPLGMAASVLPSGDCPRCQPNESVAFDKVVVKRGFRAYTPNPTCSNPPSDMAEILNAVEAGLQAYEGDYAGSVHTLLQTERARRVISDNVGGMVGEWLNKNRNDAARCAVLCVVTPAGHAITRTWVIERMENTREFHNCSNTGKDCAMGYARVGYPPTSEESRYGNLTCTMFMNWAHNKDREVRLYVFYER